MEKYYINFNMKPYKRLFKENKNQIDTPEFKKWFGKSKIVKGGKPLVIYHGTNTTFKSFEQGKIGSYTGNFGHYGYGFYFSYDPREAKTYGKNIFPVYIKMEKPFYGDDIKYLSKYAKKFGNYEKRDVAIDKKWLLLALKKIDKKAFSLANELIKHGQVLGWKNFLKNYDNNTDSIIDLNLVSDWITVIDPSNQEQEWILNNYIDEITEYLGKPKTIKDYEDTNIPQMKYMTDLGNWQAKDLTDQIKKDGYDGVIAGSELVVFKPNQIKSAIGNNGKFSKSDNITESIE